MFTITGRQRHDAIHLDQTGGTGAGGTSAATTQGSADAAQGAGATTNLGQTATSGSGTAAQAVGAATSTGQQTQGAQAATGDGTGETTTSLTPLELQYRNEAASTRVKAQQAQAELQGKLDAALKEIADSKLTAEQKQAKEFTDLQEALAKSKVDFVQQQSLIQQARTEAAFLRVVQGKGLVLSAESASTAAMALIPFAELTFDDTGNPTNITEVTERLLISAPFLVKPIQGTTTTTAAMNSGFTTQTPQQTQQALGKLNPNQLTPEAWKNSDLRKQAIDAGWNKPS